MDRIISFIVIIQELNPSAALQGANTRYSMLRPSLSCHHSSPQTIVQSSDREHTGTHIFERLRRRTTPKPGSACHSLHIELSTRQPRSAWLRLVLHSRRTDRWAGSITHTHCIVFSLVLVYISGRSFVLRDASEPRKNLPMSDRAENLEDIERRLKTDILTESVKCVAWVFQRIPFVLWHTLTGLEACSLRIMKSLVRI